ncbi:MAG: hypothetical protein Q8L10_00865 [Candidatus Moranbacteria bacterium]|nr:hypothetical protein [Candidatus Moranbacteria bacterium]
MAMESELQELISRTVTPNDDRETCSPPNYEKLAAKHGFHEGGAWIKNEIRDIFIQTLFNGYPIAEIKTRLKRVAKIRFDLDGLKTVNDIGSHRLGDVLLDLVAGTLHNRTIRDFCEKHSLKLEIDRAGGDEFDVLVRRSTGSVDEMVPCAASEPPHRPLYLALRDLIIYEVSRISFPDLDLHDPEINDRLGEYGQRLLEKAERSSGKFHFTPSVTAGECIFWDILVSFLQTQDKNKVFSKKTLGDTLMGMVEDISGDLVTRRKVVLKEKLWESACPANNLQALLLTRGTADQESAIRLHEAERINRLRTDISSELYRLIIKKYSSLQTCDITASHDNFLAELSEISEIDECVSVLRSRVLALDYEIRVLLRPCHNK